MNYYTELTIEDLKQGYETEPVKTILMASNSDRSGRSKRLEMRVDIMNNTTEYVATKSRGVGETTTLAYPKLEDALAQYNEF